MENSRTCGDLTRVVLLFLYSTTKGRYRSGTGLVRTVCHLEVFMNDWMTYLLYLIRHEYKPPKTTQLLVGESLMFK